MAHSVYKCSYYYYYCYYYTVSYSYNYNCYVVLPTFTQSDLTFFH